LIASRRDEYNRSLLEWLKPIQEHHAKIRPQEVILDKLDFLLTASDEQLGLMSAKMNSRKPTVGLR
jgi:hypothetical protein